MLSKVRSALKGVVAWFVVVLLVVAFAAWGVPELRNFTQRAALQVGDEGFSKADIEREVSREITTRRLQTGDFDRQDAIAQGLPQQVISDMATRSALEQEARRIGLAMPRDVVGEFLQDNEQFQNPRTGKFDNEVLTGILQQYNISVQRFERMIRADLLRNQLVAAAASGAGAPETFAEALMLREIETRDISFVVIDDERAGIAAEPTPDALQAYYDAHPTEFTSPELRRFTAVILKQADFNGDVEGGEAKLRELYEQNRERRYEQPERRTLYQLTFDTEAEAAAAVASLERGEPFEKLADARGLTLAAATFEDIAKDDVLDPNVAEAAFAAELDEGAVAGPVQGLFGYTVAQIAGVTAPETTSFEDARDEIEDALLAKDARARLYEAVEAIEDARDTGASLAEAAERAGATSIEFGPVDSFSFGPGGEIIADLPGAVLREAFALPEGEESSAVDLPDDEGYFFIAVTDVAPPAVAPFETVEGKVETSWRREERANRIRKVAEGLAAAVRAGESLEEAAKPFGVEPDNRALTRRQGAGAALSPTLVEDVFSAGPGALLSGDAAVSPAQAIVVVGEVHHDAGAAPPGQAAVLAQYLGYQLDQEILDAFASALRNDMGVKTDTAVVDNLFTDGAS